MSRLAYYTSLPKSIKTSKGETIITRGYTIELDEETQEYTWSLYFMGKSYSGIAESREACLRHINQQAKIVGRK